MNSSASVACQWMLIMRACQLCETVWAHNQPQIQADVGACLMQGADWEGAQRPRVLPLHGCLVQR